MFCYLFIFILFIIYFIFFTDNYRRNGVEVYTSKQPNQTNTGQLCGNTTINSPNVTRMTCDHVARYVTLYQGTNNDHDAGTAMDFKEVEVFSEFIHLKYTERKNDTE